MIATAFATPSAFDYSIVRDIPALLDHPYWNVWIKSPRENHPGKFDKKPFNLSTRRVCDRHDPASWRSFGDAVEMYRCDGEISGVGVVLKPEWGITCIDIDDCVDDAGVIHPVAVELMQRAGSFAEFSQSGHGLHIWIKKAITTGDKVVHFNGLKVEIFVNRFVAFTGKRVTGTPKTLTDGNGALEMLTGLIPPDFDDAPIVESADKPQHTDDEITAELKKTAKGKKLLNGNANGYLTTSEAEFALETMLAMMTADKSQIERIVRASGFNRPKLDQKRGNTTLVKRNIDRATKYANENNLEWNWSDGESDDPSDATDRATELQNAEIVHQENGQDIRFDTSAGRFRVWTGTHWAFDEDGAVVRYVKAVAKRTRFRLEESGDCSRGDAKKFAARAESNAGINGVLSLLETEPGISKSADAFDRDDFALNVANGTIDLNTGEMRDHRRDDLITVCIPTAFDPDAECTLWLDCINTWMGGNAALIAYVQRLAGLCATGFAGVHELPIFHGGGANGKSVFIDTITGLLGDYAGIAPETLLMARERGGAEHPTEIAGLRGKRLVVASETESGGRLNESKVKRLTGDAQLVGRFMRQDFFTIRRTWKLLLITNHKPKINEDSEAMRRRIRLVPWAVTIDREKRDPELLAKLRIEWPGILRWIVDGAVAWKREGMNAPSEVLIATDDYFDEVDPLADFVADRCIVGDSSTFRVTRTALFAEYTAWAKRTGESKPLDRSNLYDRVRRLEGVIDGEWHASGKSHRGFKGIALCATSGGNEVQP